MRQTSPAPPRSLLFKAHAVAWSLAGAASAAYLGWAMLLPSSPSGYAIHSNVGHSNVGPAAAARRFDALLSQLSGDVGAMHTKLAASEDTTHVLLGRVAALEEKSAFVAAAIQGPTASIPPSTFAVERVEGKPPAARTTSGTADITTGAILQKTAAAPVLFPPLAAGGPPAPIATTAASSSADGASAPPLPKASLGLKLSTAPNLDALRLNWSLLHERHRELLGALQTRYRQTPGKPNAPFHLIAGPVRTQADAARICKALAGSGVSCRTTAFSGEAL